MESTLTISKAMFSSWFMRFRSAFEFARLPAASREAQKQTEPKTRPDVKFGKRYQVVEFESTTVGLT